MRYFARYTMLVLLFGLMVMVMECAGFSQTKAPTGEIPAKGVSQINTALAGAKAAQIDAMVAQRKASTAAQNVNFTLNLVKTEMELDATWEFNPSYYDAKSADYHVLKFVKKPDPPKPTPPPPAAPPVTPAAPK